MDVKVDLEWHWHIGDCIIKCGWDEYLKVDTYIVFDELGTERTFYVNARVSYKECFEEAKAFALKPDKDHDDWYPKEI